MSGPDETRTRITLSDSQIGFQLPAQGHNRFQSIHRELLCGDTRIQTETL